MENIIKTNTLTTGAMLNWYEIQGILGKGGFGVTYLAQDTNLQMQVAVKEYLPEQISERASDNSVRPLTREEESIFTWGLDRFINEARTLVKFKHPNIVRVMSVFEANGTAYMVMEFEQGQNLKEFLRNPDHSNEATLKSIVGPILDGLKEIHRHGFIHRDIKPANIYIREDRSPVLLDFGSARRVVNSQPQKLTAMLTEGYAPLEQYNEGTDSQQGPWTDIYAMGAVLYFAMSGTPPLESTLRASAVLNDRPDPLPSVWEVASRPYAQSFLEGIDWALKFKVSDRPTSVDQWRRQLLVNDKTVIAPPRKVPLERTVLKPVPVQFSKSANLPFMAEPAPVRESTPIREPRAVLSEPPKEQYWQDADLSQPAATVRSSVGELQKTSAGVSNRKRAGLVALLTVLPLLVAGTTGYFWLEGRSADNTGIPDVTDLPMPLAGLSQDETNLATETPIHADEPDKALNLPDTGKVENTPESKNRYSAVSTQLLTAEAQAKEEKARLATEAKAQREAEETALLATAAKALREAEEKTRVADEAKASVAEAETTKSVSRADMDEVLGRFDQLKRAIERKDTATINTLVVKSSARTRFFSYAFENFESLVTSLSSIASQNGTQTISALLTIDQMFKDNGDIALPANAHRDIAIYSIREGNEWSRIHW